MKPLCEMRNSAQGFANAEMGRAKYRGVWGGSVVTKYAVELPLRMNAGGAFLA